VLDVDDCPGGDGDPLAGDLDRELLPRLQIVGQTPELCDELTHRVSFFNVASWFARHVVIIAHDAFHAFRARSGKLPPAC
jgi:hypothetical protein